MTWTDIDAPPISSHLAKAAGVTATVNSGLRGKRRLTLAFKPSLIEHPPEWLKAGQLVRVQMGDVGGLTCLRISKNGAHQIRHGAGSGAVTGVLVIKMLAPAFTQDGARSATPVDFDHNDLFLELTLPGWAQMPEQPKPVPAVSSSQMRGTPYRGTDVSARRAS